MESTESNGRVVDKNVNNIQNGNNVLSSKITTIEENEVTELEPLRNQPKKEEIEEKTGLKCQCGCLTWLTSKIHFLPIFTAIYILGVFLFTYGIAVEYGHVEPDFPYISYTGVHPPERGWFSQLVNVGAILMAINLYIRFLIIRYIVQTTSQTEATRNLITQAKRVLFLNKLFLTFGWISAFGLSMVANFQTVDMRGMHYTGAALAFGFGFLYCWTQSWVTWKLNKDTLRVPYLISTITEWLSVLMGCAFFTLTYYFDFKKYKLTGPSVELKQCDGAIESPLQHVAMETENHDTSSHDNVVMQPENENEAL
ncbi:hypothetical protein LOTGIDRAFT_233371 [Lottia gigantea]|uniref:CWH43-like N-terminal domain-containing protein n=1 Tax=Lottia gigantea TaxID=225164 RepID=V4BRN7_LOTGI|nr:hypothetical protein LOTGIDRAFT_233371 [Lottia gigantea]ESO91564.1 hypothetical protein LOTGIDRAFT_233371 [Lottia gigantea]